MANEGIIAVRISGIASLDEAYDLAGIEGSLRNFDDLRAKGKRYPRDGVSISTSKATSGYGRYSWYHTSPTAHSSAQQHTAAQPNSHEPLRHALPRPFRAW